MPMETGFRVLGEELDREESYLDLTVDGVDEDGRIYLAESGTDGEVWSFDADELEGLVDDLLAIGDSQIPFPDHDIWTDLDNVGQTRASVDINNWVDDNLRLAQEHLFRAILEAGRA